MTAPLSSPLSRSKKALLLAAGLGAVAMPVMADLITPPNVEAAPVQLAAATPPAPRSSATDPVDAKRQAAQFVQTYAASTPRNVLARWRGEICVRVIGLTPEQNEAVSARVVEVATDVGVKTSSAALVTGSRVAGLAGCRANIEIGFTTDPQGMLDGVKKRTGAALGDKTSPTRDVKTDTLPVQAWYLTNSSEVARNSRQGGTDGLKVNVVYQMNNFPGANMFPGGSFTPAFPSMGQNYPGVSGSAGQFCCGEPNGSSFPDPPLSPPDPHRAFRNVFVIVDGRRTVGKSLDPLADYVAMLALSQPRSEGACAPLPSVTDLFASCPGRGAPDGLTPADEAYLKALYSAGTTDASVVADRMAEVLETGKLASR